LLPIILSDIIYSRLDNVVALTFRNSSIHEWPDQLLTSFPRLKKLEAEKCKFVNMPQHVFGSLTRPDFRSLESLYLSNNAIDIIEDNSFRNVINVYMLDLSQNWIKKLCKQAFSRLYMLLYLDLSGNRLTNLNADVFKPLMSIYSIDLSDNFLITFDFDSIATNQNLNEINLNSNEITCVTAWGLVNSSVTVIRLMNNKLTKFGALKRFRYLQYLVLSGNKNLELNNTTFEGFSAGLTQLMLASVNLNQTVNYTKIFASLSNLWLLDIGKNSLRKFNPASFLPLQNLEILLIYENDLRTIENYRNIRENFPALSTIDVTGNQFKCIQLNLIRNRLKNTQIYITLYGDYYIGVDNSDARHLNLQNNSIDCEL
jgi:Leucine rich repeat